MIRSISSVPAGDQLPRDRLRSESSVLDICIVTTAIVGDNPRVVKEADALSDAGHRVRVVAFEPGSDDGRARVADAMKGRTWRLRTVPIRPARATLSWVLSTVRQRLARLAYRLGLTAPTVRDFALSKHHRALAAEATKEPADIVIAHHAPALPAAARVARTLGASLGFDAEDLHVEDRPDTPRYALERRLIREVERAYLPQCDRVTASSPGIAAELARRYSIERPFVVLNAFPYAEAPAPRLEPRPAPLPVSLYWYSQVVGLDRGLQDALHAMALVNRPMELHLRGAVSPEARTELEALARRLGLSEAIHFRPPAPPTALIALAGQHDIGLALEQPVTLNRELCITNKLLSYFTAGLAIVATDVPGQRLVMEGAPAAGFLYPPGDAAAMAAALARLTATPAALAAAKAASREAARTVYAWERVAPELVRYIGGATAATTRTSAART